MTAPLTLLQHASSTNDLVRQEPFISQSPPFAVGTLDQRAGRGRQGRTWVNRPGDSLALTIVITPRLPREQWGWYPLLTALAAVDALTAIITAAGSADSPAAPAISIKWPNDLLIPGERKMAGILCAAHTDSSPPTGQAEQAHSERLAIGIGINLRGRMDSAEPLLARAGTLSELMPGGWEDASGGGEDLGRRAARAVTNAVLDRVEQAESSTESFHRLREEYGENCITVGRVVSVVRGGGHKELTGTAIGIDPGGQLIIRLPDSSEVALSSGDVHLTPPSAQAQQKGVAAR